MFDFARWLQGTPVSLAIQTHGWVIPLIQTIHIVMIGIVFVSVLVIALRVLGLVRRDQPFLAVLDRFQPWLWSALAVMAVTGLVLVTGEPLREFTAFSFWAKMTLIVVAVAVALGFRRALGPRAVLAEHDPRFSPRTRAAAVATIVLWLAIIFLGRAIAYDVEVWGGLSLVDNA